MDAILTFIERFFDAPLPTILVVGGLVFLLLSIVGKLGALITVNPKRQAMSAVVGTLLLLSGVALHFFAPDDPMHREASPESGHDASSGQSEPPGSPGSPDQAQPETKSAEARTGFLIPNARITIDGARDDWRDVPCAYQDELDEPGARGGRGTDLQSFCLAKDGEFLFLLVTLTNGLPQERETGYFFVAAQSPPDADVPGDKDASVILHFGRPESVGVGTRGPGGQPLTEPIELTPVSEYAAAGDDFIEWKAPLGAIRPVDGRYLRVYIHPFGGPVSDENITDIRLIDR